MKKDPIYKGQRIGKLTVLYEIPIDERKVREKREWMCQCDCGKQLTIRDQKLKEGQQSCGCGRRKDLVGQRFGRLVVIGPADKRDTTKRMYWKCKCDCGNFTIGRSDSLRKGLKTSCGCIRSKGEQKINSILFENNYNFQTQYWFDDLIDERPLKFDFGILDKDKNLKCLIEYQGEQHYIEEPNSSWTSPKKHDKLKKDYCIKHNIKLIEIPYTDFDKIDIQYLKNLIE